MQKFTSFERFLLERMIRVLQPNAIPAPVILQQYLTAFFDLCLWKHSPSFEENIKHISPECIQALGKLKEPILEETLWDGHSLETLIRELSSQTTPTMNTSEYIAINQVLTGLLKNPNCTIAILSETVRTRTEKQILASVTGNPSCPDWLAIEVSLLQLSPAKG